MAIPPKTPPQTRSADEIAEDIRRLALRHFTRSLQLLHVYMILTDPNPNPLRPTPKRVEQARNALTPREWIILVCPECAEVAAEFGTDDLWCNGAVDDRHRLVKMQPVRVREVTE